MLLILLSYFDDENDKKLFEEIYYSYRKQMTAYAISILKNQDDAEDVVHNVFLCIAQTTWNTVKEIKNQTDLRNYLLKSVKNTCLNFIKANKKDDVSIEGMPEEYFYSKAKLLGDNFTKHIYDQIEYKQVVESISLLKEKYQVVLYYHFVLELPVSKTASLLGQSVTATQKQLVRGKKALLTLLNNQEVGNYVNK